MTPKGRDDHAACAGAEEKEMYIFGGYVEGDKSNELWKFDFETKEWAELGK